MKILFIDSCTCVYDTTTYLKQPLGGTQSAVSCLSRELVKENHEVTVINGVPETIETDGVRFMTLPCPTPILNGFDVVILVSAVIGKTLRGIGCDRPLVLWSHHAADQPSIQQLRDPAERSIYAGFAMVSQWQADCYTSIFEIAPSSLKVLRNAVSPSFLNNTPAMNWLKTGAPPILGYSSTPYRGLDALLLSFPSIRKQLEGTTLRIFSSMGIYGPDVPDEYSSLYDLAQALPGVTYVGALPQSRLAEAMEGIDVWAYPCTFAETSCISAMEAMASGNLLVSNSLGALPETTAGFAYLSEMKPGQTTPGVTATHFATHLIKSLQEVTANPEAARISMAKQIEFTRQNYNWTKRAKEWTAWLEQIL